MLCTAYLAISGKQQVHSDCIFFEKYIYIKLAHTGILMLKLFYFSIISNYPIGATLQHKLKQHWTQKQHYRLFSLCYLVIHYKIVTVPKFKAGRQHYNPDINYRYFIRHFAWRSILNIRTSFCAFYIGTMKASITFFSICSDLNVRQTNNPLEIEFTDFFYINFTS